MTEEKVKKKPPAGMKEMEGYFVPKDWRKDHLFLYQFGMEKGEEKLRWFKKLVAELWPDPIFIWDEWSDLYFGALCGAKDTVQRVSGTVFESDIAWQRNAIFTGASSTGKSARAAMWALCFWLCAQESTACILTSTSVDMLARRIWSDIQTWISNSTQELPLRSIPSDLEIRWNDNDRKHCIFGVAVKSGGSPQESIDRIKGIHAKRILVIIDEMTSVPDAIVKACRNLNKGTMEYQLIGLGNAISMSDPHGERSEPLAGWNSITVEDKFWLTKYGCAVHFDAFDSPAMRDQERFHFYPNKQALEEEAREVGGLNSPEAWSGIRGFWAPTGLSNTVMDEALLNQFNTRDKAVWKARWTMAATLDPSFEGGDRRVFYPFRWGEYANGVTGLEFLAPQIVEVDMTQDKRWIHYQIGDAVERMCKEYRVDGNPAPILPENFIMDVTGEGGGLFSIMSGRWSPLIQSCEFGGAAEKVQIAPDRPTTWHELYANRVTMLWYAFRRFIEGGQIRGLTDAGTITELTSRNKKTKGAKIQVVPKGEMKLSKNKSPDRADAAVIAAEYLRRKGVQPAGTTGGSVIADSTAWNTHANKVNLEETEGDYEDSTAAFAI